MELTERQKEYWRRTVSLTAVLLAIWFFVTFVVGYFGRLVRDKGIEELVAAFRVLDPQSDNLHLIVAGEAEPHPGDHRPLPPGPPSGA